MHNEISLIRLRRRPLFASAAAALTLLVGAVGSFVPLAPANAATHANVPRKATKPTSSTTTTSPTTSTTTTSPTTSTTTTSSPTSTTTTASPTSTTTTSPTGTTTTTSPTTTAQYVEGFNYPDGLITNEWAFWNPGSSKAVVSPVWEMTSGSLFSRGSMGWTGTIDASAPNATSSTATNSAVFRLVSKQAYADTRVSLDLRQIGLTSTGFTPAVAWDGVHVFLRYQSEESLYYASVNRRDGSVVIKKKCAGGVSNGGTYYTLASRSGYSFPVGSWQHVGAAAVNVSGGVSLTLQREGVTVLSVTDTGTGCAAITAPGGTGLRGDNDQFEFDNFTVK